MGLCHYVAKTIELSIHFVDHNGPEEIRDTILHEIAHALVGAGHGHNATWKKKCVEIGAKPQRCGQADMPQGRWRAACGGCGEVFHRHRKPKRLGGAGSAARAGRRRANCSTTWAWSSTGAATSRATTSS